MTPEQLKEIEERAIHRVEPWRPEASDLASLRSDNKLLLQEIKRLQAESAPPSSAFDGREWVESENREKQTHANIGHAVQEGAERQSGRKAEGPTLLAREVSGRSKSGRGGWSEEGN